MASSRSRSSSVGSQRRAEALVRTCSPRVAPEMTEETVGWAASPAIATSRMERPRSAAYAASALDAVPVGLRQPAGAAGVEVGARARGSRLAAAVLAGQQAVLQREERQHAQPEPLARGDHLALDVAVEQGVPVLHRDEPLEALGRRGPGRVRDLPPVEVRAADVAHLALVDQLGQRSERLRDRRHVVGPVQLVEVDVVGLQPAQARLHRAADVATRAAYAVVLAVRALHVHPELGGHDELVAATLERLPEHLLAAARAASP